jgi:quercetin dioxygenase-like cupin family protein
MTIVSRGYVVAPEEGLVGDMEPGRPTTFKLLPAETGGNVAVFEEFAPQGGGTPLHIYRSSDEVIYVASGDFVSRLGEETRQVSSGSWVFIPLGSVHGWRDSGRGYGRVFSAPLPVRRHSRSCASTRCPCRTWIPSSATRSSAATATNSSPRIGDRPNARRELGFVPNLARECSARARIPS